MNSGFPQKQETREKLKAKQYGAAALLCVLVVVLLYRHKGYSISCAFGCALRYCSILLIGNRLERAALGVSFLMG